MSLEAAITELTDVLKEVRDQNKEILGMAAKRVAEAKAGGAAAEKPAATKGKGKAKEDDGADAGNSATSKKDLTTALASWLNEFGKPEEHPESAARHGALKTVIVKVLGEGKTLKDLTEDDQANIDKLYNWLENTAKKAEKGHGTGRLAADPAPEASGGGDDDLGV